MFKETQENQWGSATPLPAGALGRLGDPLRLVNLTGAAPESEMVTVCVYSEGGRAASLTSPGGPVIGIATWGTGGAGGTMEFDVPCTNGLRSAGVAPTPQQDVVQGGGAMISVPAANLVVSVRNDGAFIPAANLAGATKIGDDQTVPNVSALAGMGSKSGKLTRSVWALNQTVPGALATALVAAAVPPYARTFRVLRNQSNPADLIQVLLMGPDALVLDQFQLAGNVLSPDFVLGPAVEVRFSFPVQAGTIQKIIAVYTIEND